MDQIDAILIAANSIIYNSSFLAIVNRERTPDDRRFGCQFVVARDQEPFDVDRLEVHTIGNTLWQMANFYSAEAKDSIRRLFIAPHKRRYEGAIRVRGWLISTSGFDPNDDTFSILVAALHKLDRFETLEREVCNHDLNNGYTRRVYDELCTKHPSLRFAM